MLDRVQNFVRKLESEIIKVTCFDREVITGILKFHQEGYNENYIVPSVGEIFLIDMNKFDHFFFFHEIQSIEILSDPLLGALFYERIRSELLKLKDNSTSINSNGNSDTSKTSEILQEELAALRAEIQNNMISSNRLIAVFTTPSLFQLTCTIFSYKSNGKKDFPGYR